MAGVFIEVVVLSDKSTLSVAFRCAHGQSVPISQKKKPLDLSRGFLLRAGRVRLEFTNAIVKLLFHSLGDEFLLLKFQEPYRRIDYLHQFSGQF